MKIKMLGYVESLLRKWVARSDETQPAGSVRPPSEPARPPVMARCPARAPAHNNVSHHNGGGLELPLQPILGNLPLELQPRLKCPAAGALIISIPLEKILAQLSHGVVKLPFGELRRAAPSLFTEEDDRDSVLVTLPLGEILARLNPALITRRRMQKQVEIPAEVSSPFDPRSQALIFSVGPAKPEPAPTPTPRPVAPPAPLPVTLPPRGGIVFTPPPPPPAAAPIPFDSSALSTTLRPPREPVARQTPTLAAPAPSASQPTGDPNPLLINLTSLAEGWPDAVRQELVQLSLVEAKVALPTDVVERALKQGRVAFTWKTLRSWIKPAPLPTVSVHDGLVLELPLKVVAPPFLARQKEAGKLQRKVVVDDEIPNLFFGFPKPEFPGPTAPKPADTNFYTWDETSDRPECPEGEAKPGPSPGTRFVAKYATPNEVVSRAAALDGVAGALIALPDGLMVASRLRAELNGDTLAAFLPQIFGKVNQCTRELRMGELNNLNFTVGNIPWKIFRVNAIFFAAFGRPGEALPTAQLAALASELDHRPK